MARGLAGLFAGVLCRLTENTSAISVRLLGGPRWAVPGGLVLTALWAFPTCEMNEASGGAMWLSAGLVGPAAWPYVGGGAFLLLVLILAARALKSQSKSKRLTRKERLEIIEAILKMRDTQQHPVSTHTEGGRMGERCLYLEEDDQQLRVQLENAIRSVERSRECPVQRRRQILDALRRKRDPRLLFEYLFEIRDAARLNYEDACATKEETWSRLVRSMRHMGCVAYAMGDVDTARSVFKDIISFSPDDAEARNRLGHIHANAGDLVQANEEYTRALELADDQQDPEGQAVAYGNLGLIHWAQGDLDEAEAMHRRALKIDKNLDRLEGMARNYGNLGLIKKSQGHLNEAERLLRKALKINLQLDRDEWIADTYANLGLVFRARANLDESERLLKKALDINERLERREGMANQYGNLGIVFHLRGELSKAEHMHRLALDIYKELRRTAGMANQYGNLGLVAKTRRNFIEAERLLRRSLAFDRELKRFEGIANTYGNLGLVYKARGKLDRAERYMKKALKIDKKLGRLEGMANQYGNLGLIYQLQGREEKARELWTRAANLFEQVGQKHMVRKVQSWLIATGSTDIRITADPGPFFPG